MFLCHAQEDKPKVRILYHWLNRDGTQPWLDEEDLLIGQTWEDAIPKAVRASDVVIVCLSRNFNKKGYVQKEVLLALKVAEEHPEDKTFILPVRLEPCEIPPRINALHWANLYEEGGYTRLMKSLRVCALDGRLRPPTYADEHAASRVLPTGEVHDKDVPRRPQTVTPRPRPASRPPRPRVVPPPVNRTNRSRILPWSGAAVFCLVTIIIGVGVFNGWGKQAVVIADEVGNNNVAVPSPSPIQTVDPGPVFRPEPPVERTPQQPTTTPTPAEPQRETRKVEDKDDPPSRVPEVTPSPVPENTQPRVQEVTPPRVPGDFSKLKPYTIHIFRSEPSRKRELFAESIGRYLEPHAGLVMVRTGYNKYGDLAECQIRFYRARSEGEIDEEGLANLLKKQLESVYPNATFMLKEVSTPTPYYLAIMIGTQCMN